MKITKKLVMVVVLMLAGTGALSGGIYYTWLITPPGIPKTADEGFKTIGSARYERMPEYRKAEYLEQTQKLMMKLPEDQRRTLFQNEDVRRSMHEIGRNMMTRQMRNFAKASPHERIKLLDQAIDTQEKGMFVPGFGPGRMGDRPRGQGPGQPGMGQPPAGDRNAQQGQGGGPGGGPGRGNFRERIKQFVQEGNPQIAGMMGEFRKAMRQRRIERGLPADPQRRR